MVPLALINNLHIHVKPMHQLYCILKNCAKPPTPDEIAITTGKKRLDGCAEAKYLWKLEKSSKNIKKAFEDQQACTTVSNMLSSQTFWFHEAMVRVDGIKKGLNGFSLSGLLPVTSHLMKSRNPNSLIWWILHTTVVVHWTFQNAMGSSGVLWRWVRKQLKDFTRCSQ